MTTENLDQNSEEWENLMAGYVLGDLTPEEVAEVHQLLALHPELVTEVEQLQEVLALLPLALREIYPSPKLRSQILENAQINLESPSESLIKLQTTHPTYNHLKKYLNKTFVIGGIMAALLIGLSIDSYRTRNQLAIAQSELSSYQEAIATLKQPNNRLLALKGMGEVPTASGSLVFASQTNLGFLTIQNLNIPPKNMSYCLWALVDGKKIYIAEFMPDQKGTVMLSVSVNQKLMEAKSVVITLEPKQSTPEPKGEMVMQGEVSL
jgi:anti-sigma-K factor RskA